MFLGWRFFAAKLPYLDEQSTLSEVAMTLLAAYKCGEVPVLIGDVLITTGEGAVSGFKKKLLRVHDHFAVGWTGHELAAALVLRELRDEFHNNPDCSIDDIETFLINYPVEDLGQLLVILVGWLVDIKNERAYCFRWRSDYACTVYFGSPMTDGSGGNAADELFKRTLRRKRITPPLDHPVKEATRDALTFITSLQADEFCEQKNQKLGFGQAYEALVYDIDRFAYISDVCYMSLKIEYDTITGESKFFTAPAAYKYRSFDSFSVLLTKFTQQGRHAELALCMPVTGGVDEWQSAVLPEGLPLGQAISLTSRFYCTYCVFRISDGTEKAFISVHSSLSAKDYIDIRIVDGQEHMAVAADVPKKLYELLLLHQGG